MGGTYLAFKILLLDSVAGQIGCMVLTHVVFERLAVGLCRRLPSRLFGGRIEVVRQILAVAVAHLPAGGQSGSLTTCYRQWAWRLRVNGGLP